MKARGTMQVLKAAAEGYGRTRCPGRVKWAIQGGQYRVGQNPDERSSVSPRNQPPIGVRSRTIFPLSIRRLTKKRVPRLETRAYSSGSC